MSYYYVFGFTSEFSFVCCLLVFVGLLSVVICSDDWLLFCYWI